MKDLLFDDSIVQHKKIVYGDNECNECGMRFRSAHSVMDWNRQE